MNSTDNCQNCSSSEQISIAGKTFCANCGTATASAVGNEVIDGGTTPNPSIHSYSPSIGMAPSTDVATTNTGTGTTSTNDGDDIVNSLTATLSGKPVEPTNQVSTTDTPTSTQSADENQSASSWIIETPTASPSTDNIAPTAEQQPAPQAPSMTTPPSSINKFTPSTNITDLRPVAQNNQPTPQPNSSVTPPNSNSVDTVITNAPSSVAPGLNSPGNEIASLDSKDEEVFSDDQFNQLANSGNERPAAVKDLNTKPAPAPVVVPMDTIRPVAAQTSAASAIPAPVAASVQPIATTQPAATQQPKPQPLLNPDAINSASASVSTVTPGVVQPESNLQPEPTLTSTPSLPDEPLLPPKKKSSLGKKGAKAATVTLTMAGLLLLGAYVWQVNYPNLALKVASSKAGINASIPGYLPSGWQVSNNISSSPGTISYQISSADGRASATVNQSKTDWDSQALAENYVSNKSDKYLSLQAAGLTIYVYGNQASWVNNGTWYRIEGDNTNLSQDQLIRMATSL